MKKVVCIFLMFFSILVLRPVPNTHAVIAVTDITANKTLLATYAKMTVIFTKLSAMYTVAKTHLDTAVEVEAMMSDAYETHETIKNFDIQEFVDDFKNLDDVGSDNPFGRIDAFQGVVLNKEASGFGMVDFVTDQKNRIKRLKRLAKLKIASLKNMGKASRDIKERESGQITAQSTATLAALATMEKQRKEREENSKAKGKKREKDKVKEMGAVYKAMGKS